MANASTLMGELEKLYCPPLDTATLRAILSDYDVHNPTDLQSAKRTLDILAVGVDVEEASGFDPSGSSGVTLGPDEMFKRARDAEESEDGQSIVGWSSSTDESSLSQGMAALDFERLESPHQIFNSEVNSPQGMGQNQDTQLEGMDLAAREQFLIETFPTLKPFDIKWALKKSKGHANPAIEELLNKSFLEEAGSQYRSIDGFSESELSPRPRKGKAKKKRAAGLADELGMQSIPANKSSHWEDAKRDIDFLSSNTNMPIQQVSSIYRQHGASLSASITAIVDAHTALNLSPSKEDISLIELNAQTLHNSFPTISVTTVFALTCLTHPSTDAAHNLATALTSPPSKSKLGPSQSPIQISFRLPPPDLSPSASTVARISSHDNLPPSHTFGTPSEYLALRNTAFTQAASAYRKSKSTPLMGGAAAYYSSVGRDLDARVKAVSSAAADALVAQQSSSDTVDLHGVGVKDAVRIARERVTAWWVRVGEGPGSGGTLPGFRIVTGKGVHSDGGKGKLGPAVGGMLMREGWRVEVGSGMLVVRGVVGRK